MEFVKITQEQADNIKLWTNKEQLIVAKAAGLLEHGRDEPIGEMSLESLVKTLYIGYEVDSFKVGEWVITKSGYIGEIEFINEGEKWANIGYSRDTKRRGVCLAKTLKLDEIERYATQKELGTEKERRFWAHYNRKPWQLKQGDVLMGCRRKLYEITGTPTNGRFYYTGNDNYDFVIDECKKDSWKVICFNESRLE